MNNKTNWLLLIVLLLVGGCAQPEKLILDDVPLDERADVVKVVEVSKEVARTLGWIQGVLLLGIAGGIVAIGLKQAHIGIPIFLGCAVAFGFSIAGVVIPKTLAGLCIGAGILAAAWAIYVNRTAFREVVEGGEKFKLETTKCGKDDFKRCQKDAQKHKSTTNMVKKAKEKK